MSKANSKPKSQNHNEETNPDSATEVHLLGGPRKSVSFKCNEKLWKSFVSQIRAQGLSICHVLEPMIYGWLEGKVHLSNTIRPLVIENLVVERAVRRVRRYAVESVVDGGKCWYCGRPSVGVFRYLPTLKEYPLCEFHSRELLESGNWSVIRDE